PLCDRRAGRRAHHRAGRGPGRGGGYAGDPGRPGGPGRAPVVSVRDPAVCARPAADRRRPCAHGPAPEIPARLESAMKIARALLSVWDKTGIVELARGLSDLGVEILSTAVPAAARRGAGVGVTDVTEASGCPGM